MNSARDPFYCDPAGALNVYTDFLQASNQIFADYIDAGSAAYRDELGIGKGFMEAATRLMSDPAALTRAQFDYWQDAWTLWQRTMLRFAGQDVPPVIEAERSDRRFKHADWRENVFYDYLKQSYLIAAKSLQQTLGSIAGLDEQTAKKVDFYTRQYVDALSPTNFLLTNPEVLRETIQSGGQNLAAGLKNLLADLERGNGELRVKMTDAEAFEVGGNVATTPGKVIFQNELMQLIQYAPLTTEVYRRPLLIIPPWINKYYILDLREKNSFVRWALEQGHTVFMISWVNPDASYAQKTFADYLTLGPFAALDAIEKASGEREMNAVGFCLGGTLLAATLGVMAAKDDRRIHSATFLASLIDFSDPGEVEVFIDEEQVQNLERRMEQRGFLDGSEMATTFNMLRANDLIWSFVINNYLLGKDPFPFDLLYWNSDSTRMPATMHSYYLRNMYLKNLLCKPNGLTLNGASIDLTQVDMPVYFTSTLEDHITPWKSTYAGAQLFSGAKRFVLGGSGHIAGTINPPSANKYGYWTNDEINPEPTSWLEGATKHAGSWWNDWSSWIVQQAGVKVPARIPGAGSLPALEDAPGSYVKVRLDA